jgi:peptidoglycan/xylan/chitin deacetylase (PgdA/CDA1 family)
VTAAGSAALLVHAAPAVTALRGFRMALFPRMAGVGHRSHVALTFDDGPDPMSTPQLMAALDRRGVRATFFVLGAMLARAPKLGRDLVAAGHEIAVHGWTHDNLLLRTPAATFAELARTKDLIEHLTGCRPQFFRPPHGVLTTPALVTARRLDLAPVLWTCWGKDWLRQSTPESVLSTLRAGLSPGGTILLHDSDCASASGAWRSAQAALPRLLDDCALRGLRVGPLAEHYLPTLP